MFFAMLFGGKLLFHMAEGSSAYIPYIEAGRTFGPFIVLVGFLLNTLVLYAVSSTIYLFIDIETNTRKIALLLSGSDVARFSSPPPKKPDETSS